MAIPDLLAIDPMAWQGSRRLRSCSMAARGFYLELLCLMHQGDPFGHLAVDGRPLADREVAAFTGVPMAEMVPLLLELDAAGLLKRDNRGRLLSLRMLRTASGRGGARGR